MHAHGGRGQPFYGGERAAGAGTHGPRRALKSHIARTAGGGVGRERPEEPGYRRDLGDSPGHGEDPPETHLRKNRDSRAVWSGVIRVEGKGDAAGGTPARGMMEAAD